MEREGFALIIGVVILGVLFTIKRILKRLYIYICREKADDWTDCTKL